MGHFIFPHVAPPQPGNRFSYYLGAGYEPLGAGGLWTGACQWTESRNRSPECPRPGKRSLLHPWTGPTVYLNCSQGLASGHWCLSLWSEGIIFIKHFVFIQGLTVINHLTLVPRETSVKWMGKKQLDSYFTDRETEAFLSTAITHWKS